MRGVSRVRELNKTDLETARHLVINLCILTKYFVLLPIDWIRILADGFNDGNGMELAGW